MSEPLLSPSSMFLEQDSLQPQESIEFPGGPLSLGSGLYVERPPLEEQVCLEIQKSGSVVRIQAPRKMGKSSLLNRLLAQAKALNYRIVQIDFQTADESIYSNLDRFLRWFSATVSRQLRLPPCLDDYWDEDTGSKVSCTFYFEDYVLELINQPILLALNEVNLVFEHPEIAKEFLPLLRFWHEQSKQVEAFQNLRLVIVHSTEVYVPLQIHQSPFNVGLPVKLPDFSLAQVQILALRYGLEWATSEMGVKQLSTLSAMVGGHPYRLGLAFYHLARGMSLTELLQTAITPSGIYNSHLQDLLVLLQQDAALLAAFSQVITVDQPVELAPTIAYKLNSLGLVKLQGNQTSPSCELYRRYFQLYFPQVIAEGKRPIDTSRLAVLEAENQRLKSLVEIDELTQIANRRRFDHVLATNWLQSIRNVTSIALILLDLDDFKGYNDTYGHPAGDSCLRQVARTIQSCLKRPADLVARYGGEEFAVILPETNAEGALYIAQTICNAVRQLQIPHVYSKVGLDIVTVSLGAASLVPTPDSESVALLLSADAALYQAKREGRNRAALRLQPILTQPG